MWATRCVHEAQLHDQNSFITLTYSQDNLPWDGSLQHTHFQTFIRELRRLSPSQTLRYYMCGEYGEKLSRPHYHACLFGRDFPDKEIHTEKEGLLTFTSDFLENTWGRGFCTIAPLTFETAAYTAAYIAKKITGKHAEEHYQTTCAHTGSLIQLEPEYNTMSRRPGIGKAWYDKYKSDIYPDDFLVINKSRTVKVPRFYDNLHENFIGPHKPGQGLPCIKKKRKEKARKQLWNNTPERLAVREELKQLKLNKQKRNYENEA